MAAFLKKTPLSQFPTPKNGIIRVQATDTVQHALVTLRNNNILSLPVMRGRQCIGFIDLVDLVAYLVDKLDAQETSWHAFLGEGGRKFGETEVGTLVDKSRRNAYHPVSTQDNLHDVIELMSRTGVHRIAVVSHESFYSDAPVLVNLITQSNVIQFLHAHKDELGAWSDNVVSKTGLGMWRETISVYEDSSVAEAFRLMDFARVSGVSVLGEKGVLKDVISVRDMRALLNPANDAVSFADLGLTVAEFAKKAHGDVVLPTFAVSPSSTYGEVLDRMAENRLHRVVITDGAKNESVGVIALRDLIRTLLKI
eukprot:TRINITY_DN2071_c0_g1_i10.p1 TRINITY_DN2071_c0_g1~~TRINITY_DN2071_c0_g1_i10.p1  ORF type:complete len:332 (+),score=64.27 TRINITY_DN2071_c0_g1_i10:68-997(+)